MKICYLDESGTGQKTVVIAVGVVVDSTRMNRTKHEWDTLLSELSRKIKKPLSEIHSMNLYRGNEEWRDIEGIERAKVIDQILDWLSERKHKIVFSAVDKEKFSTSLPSSMICKELDCDIQAAFFHVVLSLQKKHQTEKKNKGHTILVFDNSRLGTSLPKLLYSPPSWSDTYYNRNKTQNQLDQIVDVPFFADSVHAPLIQLADIIAYFLRLHAELHDYGEKEQYPGEQTKVSNWVNKIKELCYPTNTRYLKKGRCSVANEFFNLCPKSLREL